AGAASSPNPKTAATASRGTRISNLLDGDSQESLWGGPANRNRILSQPPIGQADDPDAASRTGRARRDLWRGVPPASRWHDHSLLPCRLASIQHGNDSSARRRTWECSM